MHTVTHVTFEDIKDHEGNLYDFLRLAVCHMSKPLGRDFVCIHYSLNLQQLHELSNVCISSLSLRNLGASQSTFAALINVPTNASAQQFFLSRVLSTAVLFLAPILGKIYEHHMCKVLHSAANL